MANLFDELTWRGLVYDATDGVSRRCWRSDAVTAYIGFDPTASSLHVGSLLPVMALARLQRFGHTPIAIVGGGTGMIGDPSGKSQERVLLSLEQIAENVVGIRAQLERFLDFERRLEPGADRQQRRLARADRSADVPARRRQALHRQLHAAEGVGQPAARERRRHLVHRVQLPVAAGLRLPEAVRSRTAARLQMGGSDQWGNITAGIDLIRKLRAAKAHGLVWPLMTTASGVKFGKTEAGTIWLDPQRTSPFRFYQFWLNTDDRDVVPHLKFFTFLDQPRDSRTRGSGAGCARAARGAARARSRGDDAGARRGADVARRARVGTAVRRATSPI